MRIFLMMILVLGLSGCSQSLSQEAETEPQYMVWEINSNEDAQYPPSVFCLHTKGENRCYFDSELGCKAAGCESGKCTVPELVPFTKDYVMCY